MMRNILILSHDDTFRVECEEALKQEGYSPHSVSTEKGMFDFLKKNRTVDLVILNPQQQGEECHRVLDKLVQQKPRVSVLLSCDHYNYWNDFYTWLADACLLTPSNKAGLKETVRQLIGAKRSVAGDSEELAVGMP